MTRMSRTVGLVLLGGAALSACCCLLPSSPPPAPPAPPPQRFDENGDPLPPEQTTGTGTTQTVRRHGPFWVPWYWGGSGYSPGYRPGPTYRSGPTSRPGGVPPGGPVTRGGFGGTGHATGGVPS